MGEKIITMYGILYKDGLEYFFQHEIESVFIKKENINLSSKSKI